MPTSTTPAPGSLQPSYKLLIQSFISPRGRDVAAIHTAIADFASLEEAEAAAARIEALPAEAYPHTKALRLYAPPPSSRR